MSAGILAALCVAFGAGPAHQQRDPVHRLVDAAPLDGRTIQPRLSGGFPWAPLRQGKAADPALLRAAGRILKKSERGSPTVRHTGAIAQVLAGRARDAVADLQTIVRVAPDGRAWNDLAAAQFVVAVMENDPARLARALVAVDAALKADPAFPEARFNRALILETLGLRDRARAEWEKYLQVDATGGWSGEAREHIRALPSIEPFGQLLEQSYDQLTVDAMAARDLARRYPQESRAWGETEILGRWAAAVLAGDDATALKHLGLAREFGGELVRRGGDPMLASLVAAIDRSDPAERAAAAEGHHHLLQGMKEYRKRRFAAAEKIFAAGAPHFAQAASPGEWIIRYYTANTIYDQGRIGEAGEKLKRLLATLPPEFRAQRALMLWEYGGVAFAEGHWGTCIERYGESAAIFTKLCERRYAATLRSHLVFVYDRIGNPVLAWKHRLAVLRELGELETSRLRQAVASVTYGALMQEDWPTALSFLSLEIEISRKIATPLPHIDALIWRAQVHARTGRYAAASEDLTEARLLYSRLEDPADRAGFDTQARSVQASFSNDPATAVALLSEAIVFHNGKGRRMRLPELLKSRGLAYLAANDRESAAADFEAGIAELEKHRESLPGGEDRWGVFHAAEDLFGEAVALALARGDPDGAFQYVERLRARALLDTLGVRWPHVTKADIPSGTAVISYLVRKNELLIFLLDEHGVHVAEVAVDRARLMATIANLTKSAQDSDELRMRVAGREVHRLLIGPIETKLRSDRVLAFVPDPALGAIPFAALVDGTGRYLVESYAMTVEPSAAVYARLKGTRPKPRESSVLLVHGGPGPERLLAADREAAAIATSYSRVKILSRSAEPRDDFMRLAQSTSVIHFAGHAVQAREDGEDGYLLLRGRDGEDVRLGMKDLAASRLPRTSLVVLAACGTAAGERRGTEGTISIARAFLAAGVPTVVATLWPIEDEEASRFFPILHHYLARGVVPAEALRATQRDWIRRGESAALWTSVQVIGD